VAVAYPQPAPRARFGANAAYPLQLLLDNWRSLFNVGAVLRSADGAGVAHVHLCGITPTPDHRRLAKTALGAERTVAWSYAANGVTRAEELKRTGCCLWVLEGGPAARNLFGCRLPPREQGIALVAGNETCGVDPGIVALADQVVALPMAGAKESLNVAVALSVAVYWLRGARALGHT
jgi:tRNA G18 (ribose-2'-O)-methylase SpoU